MEPPTSMSKSAKTSDLCACHSSVDASHRQRILRRIGLSDLYVGPRKSQVSGNASKYRGVTCPANSPFFFGMPVDAHNKISIISADFAHLLLAGGEMNGKNKGKRVTIDLSAAAVAEVDRLRDITGLTTADLFRNGFSLLRLYVDAKAQGQGLALVEGTRQDEIVTRIEMPIVVAHAVESRAQKEATHE